MNIHFHQCIECKEQFLCVGECLTIILMPECSTHESLKMAKLVSRKVCKVTPKE